MRLGHEYVARKLNPEVTEFMPVTKPKKCESVGNLKTKNQMRVIMSTVSGRFFAERKRIVGLVVKYGLPVIYPQKEYADEGGLMSYGSDLEDLYRRAAVYVDRILKGVKPVDLPVEQPMKFEFVINLKTAREIGVTIAPEVLARATRIIK